MKKTLLLSAAFALLVLPMPVVHAQMESGGVEAKANTRAAKRARDAKQNSATNAAPMFPKATREAPKQSGAPALKDDLGALFKLQEKNDTEDEIIAKAESILANPKANAFDKASAAYLAGGAWQNKEGQNYANAIKYYKLAIEHNGLHNNMHFQAMLQTAQLLSVDEKNDEALVFIDRFLAETQSDDAKAIAIKNQILLGMDKPEAATEFLEKQLAAKPDDKKLMLNLISVYQQAGQDAKAGAMFDRMRKAGLLTEGKDYEVAWRALANMDGREKDALAIIDEGIKKGLLVPGYEVYAFQGRSRYEADDIPGTIAAWAKGAPLSKDGELFLNLAKLQVNEDRWAEAKASALSARDKGVKKPGDVFKVVGQAELGLGNKAAARAAMLEAAKFPETKNWAEAALRQVSGK